MSLFNPRQICGKQPLHVSVWLRYHVMQMTMSDAKFSAMLHCSDSSINLAKFTSCHIYNFQCNHWWTFGRNNKIFVVMTGQCHFKAKIVSLQWDKQWYDSLWKTQICMGLACYEKKSSLSYMDYYLTLKQGMYKPQFHYLSKYIFWIHNIFQITWWRHEMETFSALLAIFVRNSPVSSEVPAQWPVTWSCDVSLIYAWINGWEPFHAKYWILAK